MGDPILCRLGFHKWQNYGDQVLNSWKEPVPVGQAGQRAVMLGPDGLPPRKEAQEPHSKVVCEGKQCKRCGMRLMRKFVKNPDGTLSCIGWELGTQEKGK